MPGANCKASEEGGLDAGDETLAVVPARVSIWESGEATPPQREQNRSAGARTVPQLEQELIPKRVEDHDRLRAFFFGDVYMTLNRTARAAVSAHDVRQSEIDGASAGGKSALGG